MRKLFECVLVLCMILCITGCDTSSKTESSTTSMPTATAEPTPAPTPVLFTHDAIVNDLIVRYNEIAEHIFPEDAIEKGNTKAKAVVSFDGLYVEVINSYNGFISIYISDRDEQETMLYPVFRDILYACGVVQSNEEAEQAWADIQNTRYELDHYKKNPDSCYALGNMQLQYLYSDLYGEHTQVKMLYFLE